MSFTDRKQFVVQSAQVKAMTLHRRFNCGICGHVFVEGDKARWIYCNGTPGQGTGNFFSCGSCDDTDDACRAKGKESYEQAVKLAKQWGIYGPDWQE